MGWVLKIYLLIYYPFNKVAIIHIQPNLIIIGQT